MPADVGSIRATVTADTAQFDRAMGAVKSKMDSTASGISKAGSSISSVGKQATVGLTLPIVGGLFAVGKSVADYQRNMAQLRVSTGASGDEMKRVGDLATQLGNDVKLPGTSASDAASAMLELSKGGLTLKDTMAAARPVLQLSAAAQISNADAATVTADALNAFHLSGKRAGDVANYLANAANASTADITDVAQSMQAVGAVAHLTGQSMDDTTTAIGLMANAGIKGSDAGTSLKTMLLALVNPSTKAKGVLDDLGISTVDASGHMRSMPELIQQFTKATAGMAPAARNAALAQIFGSDAVRGAAVVLTGGTKAYDKMHASVVKQGGAAKMAAAMNAGLGGAVDGLMSTVQTLALTFGQMLAPMLVWVTHLFGRMASFLGNLSGPAKTAVLVLVGIAAAVGPILMVVGALTSAVGAVMAFTKAMAAGELVAGILEGEMALLAVPIIAVVAALALLVAAFVYFYTSNAGFRAFVDRMVSAIRDGLGKALQWLMQNVVRPVAAEWQQIWTTIRNGFQAHAADIQGTMHNIGRVIVAVIGVIRAIWERVWPVLAAVVKAEWNIIRAYIKTALAVIGDIINIAMQLIQGHWGKAWGAVKALVRDLLTGAVSIIRSVLGGAVDVIKTIGSKIGGGLKDAFLGALHGLAGGLKSLLEDAINAGIGLLNKGLNVISDNWPDAPGLPGPPFGHNPIGTISLARGGVATRPTAATVGDVAGGEAVIPLNARGGRMMAEAVARAGGSSGDTYHVYVTVQGSVMADTDLADTVQRVLVQRARRQTRVPASRAGRAGVLAGMA